MRARTPTIIQMEAIECGAVSLAIILSYYGAFISLDELRERCGVSRDGAKATDVLQAAEYYQMETGAFLLTEDESEDPTQLLNLITELPLPAIAFWEFNHFLVVEGVHKGKVYLNDPAMGPRVLTPEEFSRSFTGAILTVQPGPKFTKIGHKTSLLAILWEKLKGSRKDLLFLISISLLLAFPGLITPVFSKVFVDKILLGKMYFLLRPLLFFMGATVFINAIMLWLQQNCLMRFYIKLFAGNSANFFWHILHVPVAFFNNYYTGDIVQRCKANSEIATLLSGNMSSAIVSLITILAYAFAMISLVPIQLSIVVFAAAGANILVMKLVARKIADGNRKYQQENARLYGVTYNCLQLIETIKAQGMENIFFARWAGLYTKTLDTLQSFSITSQIMQLAPTFLTGFTNLLILAFATFSIMRGDLTIGTYMAFSALMMNFLTPLNTLTGTVQSFKSAEANVERVNDVLRYKVDERFVPNAEITRKEQLTGKIDVLNLTFGYNRLAPALITDFSLSVNPGTRVALVGATGSGKSTISNLISGYYWSWEGKVLFDGQELRNLPPEVVRNSIGIVSQQIFLFEGNVRDNITLWDDTISDQDIIKALQDACIDDIVELRGGLLSKITEGGANFSVGQQQRLEIARALVRNPSILLLDEAYSALDTKTELVIDHNIRRRGCTCVIVAHRLSTIRDCDEIIALNKGIIVERGTHNALVELNGFYNSLVRGMAK